MSIRGGKQLAAALATLLWAAVAAAQDQAAPQPGAAPPTPPAGSTDTAAPPAGDQPPAQTPQPQATQPAPQGAAPGGPGTPVMPVPSPSVAPEEVVGAPAQPETAGPTGQRGRKQFGEEITVTGSRIRRKDLTTPAPVTVLTREQIQATGKVTLGDFLQSLPEQGNALTNTAVNNGGDGSVRVNLRGLGDPRTLVLVNGRRFVGTGYLPTFSEVTVDLNSIPTSAIERIEILKDGGSAVYGSDAIGGVINVITRKSFDGVELQAYTGTSQHGDGTVLDFNATFGTTNDRGRFLFTAGFTKQYSIFAGDRSWSNRQIFLDWPSGKTSPAGSSSVPAGRFGIPANSAGDACKFPAGSNAIYNQFCTGADAAPGSIIYDPTAPNGYRRYVSSQDAYNFQPLNYILTPLERIQMFSTGDMNLGGFARAYYEASFVNRQSSQQLAEEPLTNASGSEPLVISKNSLYNPLGIDITGFGRRLTEFGPRHFSQELDTFRVVLGVNGTLPDVAGPLASWVWDANVNYGRSWGNYISQGYLRTDRMQAALGPSMIDPTSGQPICVQTAGDPKSVIPGCVPINLFHFDPATGKGAAAGAGTISPDQVNYLGFTGVSRAVLQLMDAQATLSGELFRLFADRPLGLALGYEYRNEFGSNTPDPISGAGQASEGNFAFTAGGFHANEGYAELSVPILNDQPFIQNLEATAAVRVSDYSNFGTQTTWKFGARYTPVTDVTVRGTYSTAFRAPSVAELFLGQLDNFPPSSDPCSGINPATGAFQPLTPASPYYKGCLAQGALNNQDPTAQLKTRNGGNPLLQPETAKVFTVGVVLEPRWVRNLALTVDYWNYAIDHSISTQGPVFLLNACLIANGGNPDSPACQAIHRNPADGIVNNITDLYTNVGGDRVDGVDIGARYALPTEVGRFGWVFDGTWLHKYDRTLADGSVLHAKGTFDLGVLNNGSSGVYPSWKFNTGVNYNLGGFGAGVSMRFIAGYHECGTTLGPDYCSLPNNNPLYKNDIPAYTIWDSFVSYGFQSVAGRTALSAGIHNMFNIDPPKMYSAFTSPLGDPTAYDYIGRFFYLRLTQSI